jgi:hypothetical protein
MGRRECKGYKINLQEYEENADKKASKIGRFSIAMWTGPGENCYKGNDEFVPIIGGESPNVVESKNPNATFQRQLALQRRLFLTS